MEGTEEARGVNFRTLEELFRIMKERQNQHRYSVSVSVLEVYNEQIRDLLASGTHQGVVTKRYTMVPFTISLLPVLLATKLVKFIIYGNLTSYIIHIILVWLCVERNQS